MKFRCEKVDIRGGGHAHVEVEIHKIDLETFVNDLSPTKVERLLDLIGETTCAKHFDFEYVDEVTIEKARDHRALV